jgi:polar amino acid transport system permease protein
MFGTPMLVWVILTYFFIGKAVGIDSKLFWGIASLTVYFGPFMMKLYISAYESIDKNQLVVCDLFGFSKIQMYRYVIFPQMFRIMLPPLSGNLATIIKSSSLLYLIGFGELYYNITTVQSKTFAFTEGYLIMLVLYLIITIPLLRLTSFLEKRIKI